MASKPVRILRIALLCLGGLVVAALVGLQIFLNSGAVKKIVDRYAAEYVDGTVDYSRLHVSLFRNFPDVRLTLDSLSLTYPADRFAAWDTDPSSLEMAGDGPSADTLAGMARLAVAVNPWSLLKGTLNVGTLSVDGLAAYLHFYPDSTANFRMFNFPASEDSTATSLPPIKVHSLVFSDTRAVLTKAADELFASATLTRLKAGGTVKLGDALKLNGVRVSLDSLAVSGSHYGYPAPALLSATATFDSSSKGLEADVKSLKADIAHIPLEAEGRLGFYKDSTCLKAVASVDGCPLGQVLKDYGRLLGSIGTAVSTDAVLNLTASADGIIGRSHLPAVKAHAEIPASHVSFSPLSIAGTLALDACAELDRKGVLDVDLRELKADVPGISMDADGKAVDLLGKDPRIKAGASAWARLDSLMRWLPLGPGVSADGDVDIDASVGARLSELRTFKFSGGTVKASVTGSRIDYRMKEDSLEATAYRPRITALSAAEGIDVGVDLDSAVFSLGSSLAARVREMSNSGKLRKVESRGAYVPRLELQSNNERLFLKTGVNRVGISSAYLNLAAQKSSRGPYHGGSRQRPDSTSARVRLHSAPSAADEFSAHDIKIALDSSITRYLRQWRPSGTIVLGRGFFASPAMPLRTRLYAFDGTFDSNHLYLDTLSVSCGTSDLSAKGGVDGIMPFLMGRGRLDMRLAIDSRRANLNEIVAALQSGKGAEDTALSENDESFVTDTLADAVPTEGLGLIVMPGNVSAALDVRADEVNYTDIDVTPLRASVNLQDRTLQLLNTTLSTNLGDVALDAYYSTKSRSDITAGVDVKLRKVSAYDIIHLIPTVDSMMPALKSFKGELECDVSATTDLDSDMNVVMPSLDGLVRISGKDLEVEDAGELRKITRLLMFKNKNIGHIDDLSVDAVVHDGKLEVFPFQLGVDRYKMALHGMQGFDGTMNYHLSLLKSPFLVLFGVNMYGTLDNWRFSIGRARYRDGKVPVFTQQVDSVQVNIGKSIRNIFKLGVDGVRKYNEQAGKTLREQVSFVPATTELLSDEDFEKIDSLMFETALAEMEQQLTEEVDAVIEEAMLRTQDLISEYESLTYQKGMDERIARLKEQSEKKKKKGKK